MMPGGWPSPAQNPETTVKVKTVGQRPSNDTNIDGGSTAH